MVLSVSINGELGSLAMAWQCGLIIQANENIKPYGPLKFNLHWLAILLDSLFHWEIRYWPKEYYMAFELAVKRCALHHIKSRPYLQDPISLKSVSSD
jgi:hypothetical protein